MGVPRRRNTRTFVSQQTRTKTHPNGVGCAFSGGFPPCFKGANGSRYIKDKSMMILSAVAPFLLGSALHICSHHLFATRVFAFVSHRRSDMRRKRAGWCINYSHVYRNPKQVDGWETSVLIGGGGWHSQFRFPSSRSG